MLIINELVKNGSFFIDETTLFVRPNCLKHFARIFLRFILLIRRFNRIKLRAVGNPRTFVSSKATEINTYEK
jgi:hypothetical protein